MEPGTVHTNRSKITAISKVTLNAYESIFECSLWHHRARHKGLGVFETGVVVIFVWRWTASSGTRNWPRDWTPVLTHVDSCHDSDFVWFQKPQQVLPRNAIWKYLKPVPRAWSNMARLPRQLRHQSFGVNLMFSGSELSTFKDFSSLKTIWGSG